MGKERGELLALEKSFSSGTSCTISLTLSKQGTREVGKEVLWTIFFPSSNHSVDDYSFWVFLQCIENEPTMGI